MSTTEHPPGEDEPVRNPPSTVTRPHTPSAPSGSMITLDGYFDVETQNHYTFNMGLQYDSDDDVDTILEYADLIGRCKNPISRDEYREVELLPDSTGELQFVQVPPSPPADSQPGHNASTLSADLEENESRIATISRRITNRLLCIPREMLTRHHGKADRMQRRLTASCFKSSKLVRDLEYARQRAPSDGSLWQMTLDFREELTGLFQRTLRKLQELERLLDGLLDESIQIPSVAEENLERTKNWINTMKHGGAELKAHEKRMRDRIVGVLATLDADSPSNSQRALDSPDIRNRPRSLKRKDAASGSQAAQLALKRKNPFTRSRFWDTAEHCNARQPQSAPSQAMVAGSSLHSNEYAYLGQFPWERQPAEENLGLGSFLSGLDPSQGRYQRPSQSELHPSGFFNPSLPRANQHTFSLDPYSHVADTTQKSARGSVYGTASSFQAFVEPARPMPVSQPSLIQQQPQQRQQQQQQRDVVMIEDGDSDDLPLIMRRQRRNQTGNPASSMPLGHQDRSGG
ncbi:uncharacterized protein EI97DRAFT_455722 [Westerdykella ornata]|uniref:Uncharacterized protein n=1 Tax=Westerdykella ornata TaxID=318751 RepID=A0A6A6JTQ3_WESOR|nr:uncharacterized protein EI97DRAFT_455722 [Westerdykella ornata]KAF2279483.1 hypothetical protein EI97DRAFT_455722 [Westerdykella ornata]